MLDFIYEHFKSVRNAIGRTIVITISYEFYDNEAMSKRHWGHKKLFINI